MVARCNRTFSHCSQLFSCKEICSLQLGARCNRTRCKQDSMHVARKTMATAKQLMMTLTLTVFVVSVFADVLYLQVSDTWPTIYIYRCTWLAQINIPRALSARTLRKPTIYRWRKHTDTAKFKWMQIFALETHQKQHWKHNTIIFPPKVGKTSDPEALSIDSDAWTSLCLFPQNQTGVSDQPATSLWRGHV